MTTVSSTLLERLNASDPNQRFRVIVQLDSNADERTIEHVDSILNEKGGRRLSDVNLLQTFLIEATPQGIFSLSTINGIDSIMDNQRLTQLSNEANASYRR